MGEDIDKFQFNTAIARSMEFFNEIIKYQKSENQDEKILLNCIETFIKLISPLAPHFSEELWEKIGKVRSVHLEKWPEYNEKEMVMRSKEIPVQINGKVKTVITVDSNASEEEIKSTVRANPIIAQVISEKAIKKEIYIKDKIYNIVVGG